MTIKFNEKLYDWALNNNGKFALIILLIEFGMFLLLFWIFVVKL